MAIGHDLHGRGQSDIVAIGMNRPSSGNGWPWLLVPLGIFAVMDLAGGSKYGLGVLLVSAVLAGCVLGTRR